MNQDNDLANQNESDEDNQQTARLQRTIWRGILITYTLLFIGTGYIAFFQEPFNPAANPSQQVLGHLETEGEVRDYFITALEQESLAFKARKDLASQSFNVVLGALLGFLSASATRGNRR